MDKDIFDKFSRHEWILLPLLFSIPAIIFSPKFVYLNV